MALAGLYTFMAALTSVTELIHGTGDWLFGCFKFMVACEALGLAACDALGLLLPVAEKTPTRVPAWHPANPTRLH